MDNKKFDKYLKNTVKQMGLESPSIDFTYAVMSKVQKASLQNNSATYKPLISKKVWYALAVTLILVFSFLLYGNQVLGSTLFSSADSAWAALNAIFEKIPIFTVSATVVYGFVILAIFMSVQVVLLKHHFDKRMA